MAEGKKISRDSYLFREGDAPDAMYILKTGELAITKTKGTSEIILATLSPGGMVGEMAIFDMKPRSANVKALKDSEVIVLPYDSLTKQLEGLPVWTKAIMKTMNENLREANKKIKLLENANPDAERFPPYTVNKLLTILNMIGSMFGQKDGENLILPQNRLRNFTIQVFQEPTNKMQSMLQALKDLKIFEISDLGEGQQKIVNLNPNFLIKFVDWYNDWLFKQDKDKVTVSDTEVKFLEAVVFYAKKAQPDEKGFRKINVTEMQNDSMRDLGYVFRAEDMNPLTEKKLVSEKTMQDKAIFVTVSLEDIEPLARNWRFVWDLKKCLR
ncbi:MAG: Crp/Fnr family transcriptional regulator [Bdellovibrionales bacterium]